MSVGLTVYNDKNKLQISSEYINVCLKSKSAIPKPPHNKTGLFDSWNDTAMFAIRPTPDTGLVSFIKSNSNTGADLSTGTIYNFHEELPVTNISRLGLEVYDANGRLTYASDYKSINIIDSVTLARSSSVWSWSKDYGSTDIAVIPVITAMEFVGPLGIATRGFLVMCFALSSAGVLSIGQKPVGSAPSGANQPYVSSSTISFLVIDVTGY